MPKPLKRTYIKDGKVFLTPKYRTKVRANRKRISNLSAIDEVLNPKQLFEGKISNLDLLGSWGYLGTKSRFRDTYILGLNSKPLDFLISLDKPNPNIMILGPGVGMSILELHKFLAEYNITPNTDVFGLTKTISDKVKRAIRKDYSENMSFEELWTNPDKYSAILKEFLGRYDFIEAMYSVGYHTKYPEKTSFYTALMLAKGGEAYLTIDITELLFRLSKFKFKDSNKS
jgi:hypothetical protein